MFPAPPMPQFAPGHFVTTSGLLRYEDVTMDGRIQPVAIPPALGGLWREVLVKHPGQRNAVAQGIIPILTRLTITSIDQPIRVDLGTEATTGFELAHGNDPATGETARLFMNVWCETRGIAGKLSRRGNAGELVPCGRLFAEHTFTRPMAPQAQRRVTRLEVEGYPYLPAPNYDAPAPTTAQDAPDGARWLDELDSDPAKYCFSLDQTDSNQHVNSMVYIRIFLDAVNRRLASGSIEFHKLRSKAVDIAYRKPCFAGDRVRAHLRLFDAGGTLGAAGFIATDGDKPRCYVRVLLGP